MARKGRPQFIEHAKHLSGRRLFKDRMARDGVLEKFQARVRELRGDFQGVAGSIKFWMAAAREFGYIGKADEISRYEKLMIEGERVKMREELDEIRQDVAEEQRQEQVAAIPSIDSFELPPDIAWVYGHPAMLRPSDGKADLQSTDYDGAPSKGAVGMLLYAMNNKRDFYKLVLSHLSKKDAQSGDDKDMEDDLRDVREIDAMLSQL